MVQEKIAQQFVYGSQSYSKTGTDGEKECEDWKRS